MKTAYILLVSITSAGMAAYLAPSHPYWIVVTIPVLFVATVHYVTYVRRALLLHRRMEDTLALQQGHCAVCVGEDLEATSDTRVECPDCGYTFEVSPTDGFVDRHAPLEDHRA